MKQLEGYKTVIIFTLVLLNGVANLFGWGLELPAPLADKVEIILAALALVLRYFTKTAIFSK